ncbi:zinc finger protein 568-like [Harpegnathos saltator]|uniref:zinc finger protein 568-like n=1 Tax=Harpegnathos saltator TaxID=610380 RepID=UPI000DBEE2CD|nr:zinc finger protein 568-like [Harpegnathos saltator]
MSWEISEYMNMCRACMKTDGILLSMYDNNEIKGMNLPDKLMELTSIKIHRFDGLPNKLCCKCAYRIHASYDFKQQVQETYRKLLKMFEKQKHKLKKELSDEEDNIDIPTQINKPLEFILPHDSSIDISENLTTEIKDTNEDKQEIMTNVSYLLGNYDDDKENSLSWDDVLSNLECRKETRMEYTDSICSVKTEVPEDITKIFNPQQYTLMYIPKSMVNDISTTEITISDIDQEKIEDNDDTLITAIKILDKQEENIEEIPHDICPSSSVKFKTDTREKYTIADQNDDSIGNKEMSEGENNSNIEQSLLRTENTDESDSDYFIDPKDNVLGSLNDTITRIKELKQGNETIYQCALCLQNYEHLIGALLHIVDNHVPSSGPFFCVVCEKDCDSHRELRAHAKTHTGRMPYTCFLCSKAYTRKRYLKRHMVCHADLPRYRCPKCGVRFAVKTDLETHVRTHVHGTPFSCSQCSRTFNHKGNYKRHLISHLDPEGRHLPKYPCKVCGKRFLNNRTLITHIRVHTGERPYSCEVCGKSFSQQGNLLNHARIHSNPRSYSCDVCNKSFNQRATLKDHRLLHTGEKPHVCNVCGVAFTFSAALRRHMWSHTNKKPFRCDVCQAQFVGKYDLRRHMQVHTERPKVRRKRNTTTKSNDLLQEQFQEEDSIVIVEPDTETVLIDQVLLPEDVTEVAHQVESEKENVDALFNFIQYD